MSSVKPIPDGFNTVTPHIICKGGVEALEFYKRAFGATVVYHMAGKDGRLMHALMRIGNSSLMLADEYPEWGSKSPKTIGGSPVVINLYVEDADSVMKQAVKAGAKVTMDLQDTFWGDRYGTITDPFGHHWAIATHTRDVSPEEMKQAADRMTGGK